ncbi:glycosyltransferase family 2 protein [Jiangella aurantiaca]|uniref:Glycosyltransferase family 2 protein n=1 Tax=Jiangella aurantiaca TaxID=2530373 RepID=A0A4R5AH71_9ACTN|nr:glycosyltransferase family 2 protein [Jiangella aurantiaca]TDD70639.1 glycosyltransferase family 2 protein [Jiangella aurantiaca]
MEAVLVVIVLGVNFTIWTLIGGLRLTSESVANMGRTSVESSERLSPADVAVLIPAHNEEPVIAATIRSALRLVPVTNVHVIADGCDDRTAEIARSTGVHTLELNPGRGKAGGIEAAVEHFDIPRRLAVLLIVDADTELDQEYLTRGLPLLEQPGVVALAGYARAGWYPAQLSPVGRFLVSYRARLYAVMQWLKYGQTWRWTNVTSIVPGFASMYRTSILERMELNPPGLVIEDFNMTFELHRKRLGKIAFRPGVYATTQDPDNFRDYYRQVLRWHLGFWQTLRRHGFWPSGFSAALILFLIEVLTASVGIVLLVGMLVFLTPVIVSAQAVPAAGRPAEMSGLLDLYLLLSGVLLLVAALDYLLTCLTALALRRPSMLLYGVGFLALRFVDATAVLRAIPQAWHTRSDGRWTSPTRRPAAGAPSSSERGRRP